MSGPATDWGLLWRQLLGIFRLDFRRSLFSPRAIAAYLLAFAPVGLAIIWTLSPIPKNDFAGPHEAIRVFTVLFNAYITVSVFFSTLFLFVSLYRSDILEKSLHYYLLTPARREVVALGKYLAALAASAAIFLVGTATLFVLFLIPWGPTAFGNYLWNGPGLANLMTYLLIVVMACAGYGALFLLVGILFRNPILPTVVVWLWESLNFFLPPFLKRFSIIFHLESLYPVPLPRGLVELTADPAPLWIAVSGALLFILLVLAVARWKVRRMDLAYGGE